MQCGLSKETYQISLIGSIKHPEHTVSPLGYDTQWQYMIMALVYIVWYAKVQGS